MATLAIEPLAVSVKCSDEDLYVVLADGRTISVPLAYFPRLLVATREQREDVVISGGGIGLHWEAIDEDISTKGLLMGIGDRFRKSSNNRIQRSAGAPADA